MLIRFMISGGFAGSLKGCEVDTRSLAAVDRREIESLVAAAAVAGTQRHAAAADARDLRQISLLVEAGDGRTALLECDERNVPDRARPLVAALAARSTPQPLSFADAFPAEPGREADAG